MARVPFRLKYAIGQHLRRGRPPYELVRNGSVVVQVGAPRDTLRSGRSRGMHFALRAQGISKVIATHLRSGAKRKIAAKATL